MMNAPPRCWSGRLEPAGDGRFEAASSTSAAPRAAARPGSSRSSTGASCVRGGGRARTVERSGGHARAAGGRFRKALVMAVKVFLATLVAACSVRPRRAAHCGTAVRPARSLTQDLSARRLATRSAGQARGARCASSRVPQAAVPLRVTGRGPRAARTCGAHQVRSAATGHPRNRGAARSHGELPARRGRRSATPRCAGRC